MPVFLLSSFADADCGNPISLICKSGKISTVGEWLAEREISSPLSLLSQIRGVATEESDEEVDVVSSVSTRKGTKKLTQFLDLRVLCLLSNEC